MNASDRQKIALCMLGAFASAFVMVVTIYTLGAH
jgi:hypothetical protein